VSARATSILLGVGIAVAPGQAIDLPLSLTAPAPVGGLTVNLVSDDTNIATVTASVFVPEGTTAPVTLPRVTGVDFGIARISASGAGVAPDAEDVSVTRSFTLTPADAAIAIDGSVLLALTLSAPAPPGGLQFAVSSTPAGIVTVPSSVTVPAGATRVDVEALGVAAGTTTVHVDPADVDDPSHASTSIAVAAGQPMSLVGANVGKDLQERVTGGALGVAAPPGGQPVSITSADPAKVLLSKDANTPGTPSIALVVGAGKTAIPAFYVQALAATGTAEIVARAAGFGDGRATIAFQPSGFTFPSGDPNTLTVGEASADPILPLLPARLHASTFVPEMVQALRAGAVVHVDVTRSDTNVAAVIGSPVALHGAGELFKTSLDTVAPGTADLTIVPPPGFATPATGDTLAVTVLAGVTPATHFVGPTRTYKTLKSLPALHAGDVVEIDSGVYNEALRWLGSGTIMRPILIRGAAGSRPVIDGTGLNVTGQNPHPRALFEFRGNNWAVENLEFRNAHNKATNGSGIRVLNVTNVTVRDSYIHHNDMGIQASGFGELLFERLEVAFNGKKSPYKLAHNIYIGDGDKVVFRYCYVHDAVSGQNVKTRTHYVELLYSYIADSNEGEVVLVDSERTAQPNSNALVMGNVIVSKTVRAGNRNKFVEFGSDTGHPPDGTLSLINNTMVAGNTRIEFLWSTQARSRIEAYNNIFSGSRAIVGISKGGVSGAGNWVQTNAWAPGSFKRTHTASSPGFVSPSTRDFHLLDTASARDGGEAALGYRDGKGIFFNVLPQLEYVEHLTTQPRPSDSLLDIGAFEFSPVP
jgi:hypothetical protein